MTLEARQHPSECERFALVLPLLDDPDLAHEMAQLAQAHLATCSFCRADRARYQRLDRALQHQYGVAGVRRRATEEIMEAIEAKPSTRADHPSRTRRMILGGIPAVASVAVIAILAFALLGGRGPGGFTVASGTLRQSFPGVTGSIASVSMIDAQEGWALGITAHSSTGDHPANELTFYHGQNGTWTPTYVQTSKNFLDGGTGGFNGTITMDSAADGWAVVHNFNRFSAVLHYTNGTWTEVKDAPEMYSLQALGPQSVWGISGGFANGNEQTIVHFNGTTWTRQTLPIFATNPGPSNGAGPTPAPTSGQTAPSTGVDAISLQMLSDSEGWATVRSRNNDGKMTVLRYHNAQWSVHSQIDAYPNGGFEAMTTVSSLAMRSPDEGWALGERIGTDAKGDTTHVPYHEILFHYTGGTWHEESLGLNPANFVQLFSIQFRSANDGWIVGIEQNAYFGATTRSFLEQPVIYHYDGATWKRITIPQTGQAATLIAQVGFAPDGTGWGVGYVSSLKGGNNDQTANEIAETTGSPLLMRYQNGTFQIVGG